MIITLAFLHNIYFRNVVITLAFLIALHCSCLCSGGHLGLMPEECLPFFLKESLTEKLLIAGRKAYIKRIHAARVRNSSLSEELKRILECGYFEDQRLEGHIDLVRSISISHDGELLVSGSQDNKIKLWKKACNNYYVHQTLVEGQDWVKSVGFSPDGEFVASGNFHDTICLWQKDKDKDKFQFSQIMTDDENYDPAMARALSFSKADSLLASGASDNSIDVWRLGQDKEISHQSLIGHTDWVLGTAFSPDNRYLATASNDKTVRLWKEDSGLYVPHQTLVGHQDIVRSVKFSPDGSLLASGSFDKTITLWKKDADTFVFYKTLCGHTNWVLSQAFSFDGLQLISCSHDKMIKIWKMTDFYSFAEHAQEELIQTIQTDGRVFEVLCIPRTEDFAAAVGNAVIVYRPYASLLPEQTDFLIKLYGKEKVPLQKELSLEDKQILQSIPQGAWPKELREELQEH